MTTSVRVLAGILLASGCGGVVAEQPLTIPLGIDRLAADAQLQHHKYCHKVDGPRVEVETYPRCDRTGTEWGESWVQAHYDDKNKLVELRRYERYSDEAHATERWNQLVAERGKLGVEGGEAATALRAKLLEHGTRAVKAFRIDASTVVGVYLLTPKPPEDASILEAVIMIPKP